MQQFSSSEDSNRSGRPSGSEPMIQARIDAYLNRTCTPLFLSLPHEEAVQQRAEMQSHLESLAAAYIELGASEIEAVTQALEQFGKEQSVAYAWKQECEKTQAEAGRGTFCAAICPAIRGSLLNRFLYPLLLAGNAYLHGYKPTYWMHLRNLGNIGMALIFMEFLLFPIYLGFLVGRRTRGRILALSLLALPGITALSGYLSGTIYEGCGLFSPYPGTDYHRPWGEYLLLTGVSYAVSLSLSAAGAGAAVWRRRKTLRLAGSR